MNKKIFFNCFSLVVLGSIFMITDVSANDKSKADKHTFHCDLDDLKGLYNVSFQGSWITFDPITKKPVTLPVAVVGLSIYDGQGGITSTIEMNINGASERHENVIGSYQMDSNCTGEGQIINSAGLPQLTIWGVVGHTHREKINVIDDFVFTSITPGFVGNGTGTKLGRK